MKDPAHSLHAAGSGCRRHLAALLVAICATAASAPSRAFGASAIQATSMAAARFEVLEFCNPGEPLNLRRPGSGVAHSPVQVFRLKINIPGHPGPPPELRAFLIASRERPALEAAIAAHATTSGGAAPIVVGLYEPLGRLQTARRVEHAGGSAADSNAAPAHEYSLVVLSNPMPGRERPYNEWYDHEHVPDVLRVPGFLTGQRLKLVADETPGAFTLPRYAVWFTLRSRDLEATVADVRHRLATGVTRPSPDFDMASSVTRYYEPRTKLAR